jgi:hypothetical protein
MSEKKNMEAMKKIWSRVESVASRSLFLPSAMFSDPEFPIARVAPMSIARTTFL